MVTKEDKSTNIIQFVINVDDSSETEETSKIDYYADNISTVNETVNANISGDYDVINTNIMQFITGGDEFNIIPKKISECALYLGKTTVCASDKAVDAMSAMTGVTGNNADIVKAALTVTGCNSERCIISSKAFNNIAGNIVSNELKTRFKVSGPTNTNLLSNFNIDESLKQWTIAFKDFFPYNFNMADYDKVGGSLSTITMQQLYPKYRRAACVINSDVSTGRGKHWMALFVDMSGDHVWTVEFFNSSGNPPAVTWVNWLVKTKYQLEEIIAANKLPIKVEIIKSSDIRHQHSLTECGVYSLYYIWARLNGISYMEFKNKPVSDEIMFEFRQHLFFDDKRPQMDEFDYQKYAATTTIKWEM